MAYDDFASQILQNTGHAPRNKAVQDSFQGLNIIGRNPGLPVNTSNHGYTFFTRPYLNLSDENCMVDRRLSQLLVQDSNSIQRMIRAYLDPRAQKEGLECRGVDPLNPFITLLSNNMMSLTGWEDFTLNMASSTPGVYRDVMSYVDDVPYQYGTWDASAQFRNLEGDPITQLFFLWEVYMGLAKEGRIMPYPDAVLLNEMDYNTRFYRLEMDYTRTYVTRIYAPGAAVPTTAPTGRNADYTGDGSETGMQAVAENIGINFRCMGVTTYDFILLYEFNAVMEMFNPLMKDENRSQVMVQLKPWEKEFFNYRAYPRINVITMELEWWCQRAYYDQVVQGMLRKGPAGQ
jgi:hypothetical protein